jgi:hypothetical protein
MKSPTGAGLPPRERSPPRCTTGGSGIVICDAGCVRLEYSALEVAERARQPAFAVFLRMELEAGLPDLLDREVEIDAGGLPPIARLARSEIVVSAPADTSAEDPRELLVHRLDAGRGVVVDLVFRFIEPRA